MPLRRPGLSRVGSSTARFETRTLTPFAIYCLIAGAASVVRFAVG